MRYYILVLSVFWSASAGAQKRLVSEDHKDVSVKRDDFAYGAKVEVDPEHALQRVVLPGQIYDQLTRDDASDLAVFNEGASQVPHALRRASDSVHQLPDVNLPVFPLKTDKAAQGGEVAIRIERGENGAVTSVHASDAVSAQTGVLTAYIADVGEITQPLRSLTFRWRGDGGSFVQHLTVAASDDLETWRTIADDVTVASLVHEGHRIDKERVEVAPIKAKYLRISWPGAAPPRELELVIAGLASSVTEPARDWAQVSEVTNPKPGVYRFHLPGLRPVDRVRVLLPEDNTLAEATLASSSSVDGPWNTRYSGLIYRLDKSGVGPKTINVGDVAEPFWQLEVSTQGGGIGNGTPRFEVGWLPHELLFARRGEAPFTIGYGNANRGVPSFDPAALASLARAEGGESFGEARIVKAGVELGGASRLVPTPPDTTLPVRRIVLWASLAVAVLLLGWMSFRLFRQMGSQT